MSTVRRNVVQRAETPEAAAVAPEAPALTPLRDATWGIAQAWDDAGWPWLAALIRGAVVLTKGPETKQGG